MQFATIKLTLYLPKRQFLIYLSPRIFESAFSTVKQDVNQSKAMFQNCHWALGLRQYITNYTVINF